MDKELLLEIKKYIEETEVTIDGEWGDDRELDELIKDGVMPELYWKIVNLIKEGE